MGWEGVHSWGAASLRWMEPKAGSPMFCCCLQWGSSGVWVQLFPSLCSDIPICETGTAQLCTQTPRRDSLVLAYSCEYTECHECNMGVQFTTRTHFGGFPATIPSRDSIPLFRPRSTDGDAWSWEPKTQLTLMSTGPYNTFLDGRSHPSKMSIHPPTPTLSSLPPLLRLEPHLGVSCIFTGWGENKLKTK